MRWYVWWNTGGCNDGDHSTALEEFASKETADAKVKELQDYYSDPRDISIKVIHGTLHLSKEYGR